MTTAASRQPSSSLQFALALGDLELDEAQYDDAINGWGHVHSNPARRKYLDAATEIANNAGPENALKFIRLLNEPQQTDEAIRTLGALLGGTFEGPAATGINCDKYRR